MFFLAVTCKKGHITKDFSEMMCPIFVITVFRKSVF